MSTASILLIARFEGRITWFNVVQCVSQELFPDLAVRINQLVKEKMSDDATFKMDDIGMEAAQNVIERLKNKRSTNNKEISYLNGLFRRAHLFALNGQGLVSCTFAAYFQKCPLQQLHSSLVSHLTLCKRNKRYNESTPRSDCNSL